MELVMSARVVCLSRPHVIALPHVCDFIASCLAPPKSWTIETAICHGCAHLAQHLLDELADNPKLHYLVKRSRARRYLSVASSVGDIALMAHLVERFGCCVDALVVKKAVKGGHLEALQWLYDQAITGLTSDDDVEIVKKHVLIDYYMILASRIGHLEMLQWLQNAAGGVLADWVLHEAARNGHVHVVEWVVLNAGASVADLANLDVIHAAAVVDNIDVAKFVLSRGLLPLSSSVMDATAGYGQLELLQWMYENGGEGCTDSAIDQTASNGHLDTVQYLHSKGLNASTKAMDGAARNGHFEVVKFLDENRFEGCTLEAFSSAVRKNRLDVAQYLFEHRRADCTSVSIDRVARKGGIEMLKWLQNNCPDAHGSTDAMDDAAANGKLEVVRFLHDNRTEGCTMGVMDQAAGNGHLDVVKWLHFNRTEGCTTGAMDYAAKYGHLTIVKFLHTHRAEGCTTAAMNEAHNLEILQWLSNNRRDGFTNGALFNAVKCGDLEMLMWLFKRTPAEFLPPMLVEIMVLNGQIEMLEWLTGTIPALVDARALSPDDQDKWWVWAWLKQRVDS
jgi:hypothetical protein